MTGKRRDNLVSGGIALASLVILLWVIPTFTPPYPGYGVSSALLPNLAFGIILVLSLLSLGHGIITRFKAKTTNPHRDSPGEIHPKDRVHLGHLVSFMIPCFLLMPAMKWMGFIPGGLLFMLIIQYICGQRKPVTLIIVAVCSVGAVYAAMRYGLRVPMP